MLKACLDTDRSFDLLKERCMDDSVLKQFISIRLDVESTFIRCKNSLFTCLVEKHLHHITFCCIVHKLELVIKESVGKGLLSDSKYYFNEMI